MEQSPRRPVEVAKPKPMTKRQIVERIALLNGMKQTVVMRVLDTIASKTQENLITTGTSRMEAFVRLKIVQKPPRVECQRWHFGKMTTVRAPPPRNIVKAFLLPRFRAYLADQDLAA